MGEAKASLGYGYFDFFCFQLDIRVAEIMETQIWAVYSLRHSL